MHRRLAVVLAVWIAFQSLTGLVLVFRDPIEHHAHPGLTRHGRGDLGAGAAVDAVRRRFPGQPVGPLATPAVSDGVYVVEVGEREVYVDPATARINAVADHDAGFTALVERLHRRFLFDDLFGLPGAWLVALLGIGWLVVAGSGVLIRARQARTGRGGGTGVRHRRLGLVVAAPMVLVVLTGVRLAVPGGSDRIWAALTGSGEARPDVPPAGVTVRSADRGGEPLDATRALAAVRRKYPDGLVARLLLPPPGDRVAPVIAGVSLGLDPGRGDHDYGGNTVVFLDQFSGATLWEGRPDRVPAARQAALLWSRPLHTGAVAGSFGDLLWGWLALAIVALTVTGWRTRRDRIEDEREEPALPWAPAVPVPDVPEAPPVPVPEVPELPGVPAGGRNGRRQLRRRRILARRRRLRADRAARERRRSARRLERRRKYQARIGLATPEPEPAAEPTAEPLPAGPDPAEHGARPASGGRGALLWCSTPSETAPEPRVEIDLREPALEIDLTDAPAVYESTITLETGETVESGLVGPAEPR